MDRNDHYEGEFSNGGKEGYGKLTNKYEKYIGNFHNNMFSGHGQLIIGKEIYVGQFKDGMRHGCGKNQGTLNYDGEWVNDQPHGSGIMKDGEVEIIGQFVKGKVDESAEVTLRYTNGSMYKGMVKGK